MRSSTSRRRLGSFSFLHHWYHPYYKPTQKDMVFGAVERTKQCGLRCLTPQEFLDGCTRLKGSARSMDVHAVLADPSRAWCARMCTMGFVWFCVEKSAENRLSWKNRYSSNTWSERMVFISYNRFEANWTMIWPWPFNLRNAEEFEERLVPRQILQPIWGCKEMQRNAMFVPDQFPHSSPAFAAWHTVKIGTSPRLGRSSHRYSVLETPNDRWLVCC